MNEEERIIESLNQRIKAAQSALEVEREKNRQMEEGIRRMEEETHALEKEIHALMEELQTLRKVHSEQMEEIQRNVQMMTDFILNKDGFSLSGEMHKAVEEAIRAKYDFRLKEKDEEIAALTKTVKELEKKKNLLEHYPKKPLRESS